MAAPDVTSGLDRPSPWITVPQAAKRVQVNPKLLYAAIAAGTLQAVRLTGRTLRIHEEAFTAWLESRATTSPGPARPARLMEFPGPRR